MNLPQRFIFNLCCLLALILISACTLNGHSTTSTPSAVTVSIADIQGNYTSYEGQLVIVKGYGVIMMTLPLCSGYIGMDTRLDFLDEANSTITAVVKDTVPGAERSETLREFQGYVRVFNREIGCPGSLHTEIFPYFEIKAIK